MTTWVRCFDGKWRPTIPQPIPLIFGLFTCPKCWYLSFSKRRYRIHYGFKHPHPGVSGERPPR